MRLELTIEKIQIAERTMFTKISKPIAQLIF